jgi:hypothetical protein
MTRTGFPSGRFLTLRAGPIGYNFRGNKWFIPADLPVGKIFDNAIVASLRLSAPLHYDLGHRLCHRRAEALIGLSF